MTNPYRAMCAELAEELVSEYGYCTEWEKGLPLCVSNVSELLTRARALLAQPVAQPVAVSERLPGPEDCIFPTGECWWFDPHADGAWYMDTFQGNYTHWLPANALPTPEAAND